MPIDVRFCKSRPHCVVHALAVVRRHSSDDCLSPCIQETVSGDVRMVILKRRPANTSSRMMKQSCETACMLPIWRRRSARSDDLHNQIQFLKVKILVQIPRSSSRACRWLLAIKVKLWGYACMRHQRMVGLSMCARCLLALPSKHLDLLCG
jgi:hypothetical protein